MNDSVPTPADVVGVPFLPPAPVTMTANHLRRMVAGLARRMAPPPVAILEGLFGLLDHRILVALCEADVPDALVHARTTEDLARATGSDHERLERLLRAAATRGWVRFDRRGRVCPTRVLAFLRRGHPGGWRAWVDFAGGPEVTSAVARLSVDRNTTEPFLLANGVPFFEWMAEHPARWAVFDAAMAAGGRMHALALVAALDWSSTTQICDVGGGTGALLATFLDLVPGATGTVVDLPAVVARAERHHRMTALAGDMFRAVPGGFDTYLLVNVLHDWGDAEAQEILRSIAAVLGTGRVVVVDADVPARPRDRMSADTDILMAALTGGGQERDGSALAALAAPVGLHVVASSRLASGDRAHEFQRSTTD